ncbi:MAG: glycoside hydrolase family 18 [Herbinix sp.]|jgi:chitinase|nr:glycoside hydrolase family 18 [Herbinix sp.]
MMNRLLKGYGGKKRFIVMILVFVFIFNASFSSTVFAAKPSRLDKTSPTMPLNLRLVATTDTSVSLSWDASTDNISVNNYEVYMDNVKIGTTYTTTYKANYLTPEHTYQFYIRAKDAAGNSSSNSNTLVVTTLRTTSGIPTAIPTISATPTPLPTVIPTIAPTATPAPSIAPTAIPIATPIATPSPTVVPTATPNPTVTVTPIPTSIPTPSTKLVGYYAAWAAYSGFTPEKIDANKLTHINYAFANIGSDLKITLGYPDVDPSNIAKLNALKQSNPNLKTLIAVGGWSWSARFSDAALTAESRSVFANSCVDFIVKYGFNGIDIDWEYPVAGGLSTNIRRPEDKYNFTLLMQTLREKLDAREVIDGKEYLLSFAGAAGSWYVNNIELSKLQLYIDYANIMTYDIHGTWDTYTDFNAPLYNNNDTSPQLKWSVDTSINTWLKAGFPADKLILGVPFYGYLFKAVADVNHGLYQTYSGSASISYANIAANYLNASGYTRYFHAESMVPWLYNGSTFITYEDEESMRLKAEYIKTKGLGGAMIWELSQDPNRVLLNAIYNGLK